MYWQLTMWQADKNASSIFEHHDSDCNVNIIKSAIKHDQIVFIKQCINIPLLFV